MQDQTIMDKSLRSVFVGNIPYEATEEKLKDIFNEVGPVISFKLVYDRETGKPKGYGFCEYKDQETALSAMRNLNSYEIGGRTLRVDNACTEKSRMEMQSLMQGPPVENPYGDAVQGEKAPEAISKAVASLPPEQMFELMKQMKLCVVNNPNEARAMLLQNPQLAYALLQAQVVMRLMDPATALSMLHRANPVMPPLMLDTPMPMAPAAPSAPLPVPAPAQVMMPSASDSPVQTFETAPRVDPRLARVVERNPEPVVDHYVRDPRMGRVDPRTVDPRSVDPRTAAPRPQVPARTMPIAPPAPNMSPGGGSASDQEKAALIMQVLQLSDEQIAMLPPEQRQSILVLKEQIAKSTQR